MEGESSNTPLPTSRRNGRNRKTTPLVASFKQQLNSTPQSEIDALSKQLNIALSGISIGQSTGNAPGFPATPKMGGLKRMNSKGNSQAATSAGRMLLGRPNFPPAEKKSDEEEKPSGLSKGLASTGQLNRRPSSRARRDSRMGVAASMTARIPDWDGYYKPISSSRRNSRAGSELAASMKKSAQAILADLGEVTDDEDDDEWLTMPILKEESLGGLLREDSNYQKKSEDTKLPILSA